MIQQFLVCRYFTAIFVFGLISTPLFSRQVEKAADVLPGSTAIYVEITRPADLINEILRTRSQTSSRSMTNSRN